MDTPSTLERSSKLNILLTFQKFPSLTYFLKLKYTMIHIGFETVFFYELWLDNNFFNIVKWIIIYLFIFTLL